MKREIKFRAWDNYQNCMYDWNDLNLPSSMTFIDYCNGKNHYIKLMQYTGLKDKNGVEIYEGDVLLDGEHTFRVYDTTGGFTIKASVWRKDLKDAVHSDLLIWEPLTDAQLQSYIKQSCEIIGNIHENPELL
jgi:uncharacterized phage protein (TIGR01671 family)